MSLSAPNVIDARLRMGKRHLHSAVLPAHAHFLCCFELGVGV
jgi:hypothetical protein